VAVEGERLAAGTTPPKYMCGFGRQLYVLSSRQLANLVRHPLLCALVYGSSLGAAVLLGLVFHDTGYNTAGIQNRLGSLFFMVMFLALLSLSILPVWREQQLLFVRERDNGCYGTAAYFTVRLPSL
jgi:ATP-binding cassette subfamily G (WHITE) protein 2